jgi:predicted nucleic acid-binding Zn ribbon protein
LTSDRKVRPAHKGCKVSEDSRDSMVSKVSRVRRERAVWMVVMALTVLMVYAVLRVTQDRSVPWVRRVPPGHQVRRGSRAHRERPDPPVQPVQRVYLARWEPRVPP